MKTMRQLGSLMVRIAVIWGFVFGAVLPGGAQEKTKAQEAAKKTDAAAQVPGTPGPTLKTVEPPTPAAEKSPGGPHEGIKVHGHWSITIRNEDGSVASRHEFENKLNDGSFLSLLLAGSATVPTAGSHQIWLNANGSITNMTGICGPVSAPSSCIITDSLGANTNVRFNNLSVTAPNGTLLLVGSAKASNPGRITDVSTSISVCLSGGGCSFVGFTLHDLTIPEPPSTAVPTAINVVAGQTIDVTVTISFS